MPVWLHLTGTGDPVALGPGTLYPAISGATYLWGTEDRAQVVVRDSYTLAKLFVRVSSNTLDGSTTVRSRKNGANGNQSVSIGAGATGTFEDTTNSDSLVSGDLVAVQIVRGGTSGSIYLTIISFILEHATDDVPIEVAHGLLYVVSPATNYHNLGGALAATTIESRTQYRLRVGGTASDIRIYVYENGINADTIFRLRKNGANASPAVTIPAKTTGAFEDTVNTESFVAGDLLNYQTVVGGHGGDIRASLAQMKLAATGRIITMGRPVPSMIYDDQVRYAPLECSTNNSDWETTTESKVQVKARITMEAAKFYLRCSTNTLDAACTFVLRRNGATSSLGVSIGAGLTGEFEDTTDTVSISATDLLNFMHDTSAATTYGYIVVQYVGIQQNQRAPATTTQIVVGGSMGDCGAYTSYCMPFGAYNRDTTDIARRQIPASPAGTIRNFRVRLSVAPGAGTNYTLTFMKGAAAQAVTVTISDTDTTGEDTTHSFTVSPGDLVAVRVVGSAGAAASKPSWSFEFMPDTDNKFWIGTMCRPASASTLYQAPYGGGGGKSTESNMQVPMPIAGVFSDLYVQLNADPGTAPDAYTFKLRWQGADTPLSVTIVADDKTGNDTVNTHSVAAGELVNLVAIPVASPSVTPWAGAGMTFTPDTSGKAPVLMSNTELLLDTGADRYNVGAGLLYVAWDASDILLTLAEGKLENLYCKLDGAPGAGKSYTVTMRRNGGDAAVTVLIADAATSGNDTTHNEQYASGDRLSVEASPSGTPTARRLAIGFTLDMAAGPNLAEVNGVAAANIGEVNQVAWTSIAKINEVG